MVSKWTTVSLHRDWVYQVGHYWAAVRETIPVTTSTTTRAIRRRLPWLPVDSIPFEIFNEYFRSKTMPMSWSWKKEQDIPSMRLPFIPGICTCMFIRLREYHVCAPKLGIPKRTIVRVAFRVAITTITIAARQQPVEEYPGVPAAGLFINRRHPPT